MTLKPNCTNEFFFISYCNSNRTISPMNRFLGNLNISYYSDLDSLGLKIGFVQTTKRNHYLVITEYCRSCLGCIGYSYKMVHSWNQFNDFYIRSHNFYKEILYPSITSSAEELLSSEKILVMRKHFEEYE